MVYFDLFSLFTVEIAVSHMGGGGNRMFPCPVVTDSIEDADVAYQKLSRQSTQTYIQSPKEGDKIQMGTLSFARIYELC